ncbi:hypothetical protein HN604_03005 [archaeon]|jgi:hypothetical protein|nr:hypothetical protein [archaeon]MBT6183036.1 hypothetical protein [archaeon]MBT6606497.1 hypothetical protein [archaeon]MBT7251338.1 hypothetical protein [archaeon]MBT7661027.1 hypothetical protein [archaeon]
MKESLKLKVSVTKKNFFISLAALFILTSSFIVFAFDTNDPTIFGHDGEQVEIDLGEGLVSLDYALNSHTPGSLDCYIAEQCFVENYDPGNGIYCTDIDDDYTASLECNPGYTMMGGSCIDWIHNVYNELNHEWQSIGDNAYVCSSFKEVEWYDDRYFTIYGVCCK